jgi:hypothetical protein
VVVRVHEARHKSRSSIKEVFFLNTTYKIIYLEAQQKYTLDVKPRSPGKYEVEVSRMVDGGWSSLYRKQTQTGLESLNLHKLAPSDSTYSFCFSNTDEKRIALALNIQSGLELMEFEMLPDKSDSENLERELGWLKSEKARLFESLERM